MGTTNLLSIFLFLSLILTLACERSEIEPTPTCMEIEEWYNAWGQPLYTRQFPSYQMPYFNPHNSDEIIFRYADGITPEFDLIKYNWRTKIQETIYTGFFNNRPRWGKQDWILLNIQDSLGYNIYKLRSDGSELTPLTMQSNCQSPEWNNSGDEFIYEIGGSSPVEFIVANPEAEQLDTFEIGPGSTGSWQHPDGLFANGTFQGLFIGNLITGEYEMIYDPGPIAQSRNGAEWLDATRVLWCHTTGIYITDISTRATTLIRPTPCFTDTYQYPSYAADINKVIFQRVQLVKVGPEFGKLIYTLAMMNLDGSDEQVIRLVDQF